MVFLDNASSEATELLCPVYCAAHINADYRVIRRSEESGK